MTVLGAGLLWFGWFGFNAGSALTAGGLAASAFIVTNTAAAAATLTWVLASYLHKGKASVIGAACGAVAGLVAITPGVRASSSVGGALFIGLAAGGLCYSATLLRERIKVDDALDVFAVHGVGGMFGALATGVFATAAVQPAFIGLLEGNPCSSATQLVAVGRDDRLRRRRHLRHRQGRRRHPRDPGQARRRGARPGPVRPRRGRLPGLRELSGRLATVPDSDRGTRRPGMSARSEKGPAARPIAADTEPRPGNLPIDNPSATGCDSFPRRLDGILPATERTTAPGSSSWSAR